MDVAGGGKFALLLRQVFAINTNNAARVEHHDVFLARAKGAIETGAGNGGRTGTVHNDAGIFQFLACHVDGVDQAGSRDDGRSVLVVVHHWDVELSFQAAFNLKTLRCLDVFQVDATERRGNGLHCLNELVGVFLVDFDVESVNAGIYLKEQTLTFHHWFAAHGTDVAQAEHRCSV